ncbi:endoplasmic reticulum metallopeptidase 1 isoform X2 [Drosophila miranda]|uniref:endoplasmic reticulum metallopeptidase 1 isoform X2 n=1 Tax=Drosophila miranda TaxID=7229 RepID=UPI0007E78D1E|nr:endoplasmic reticulum metallopeptidase 1 isoform X2 [Drosophila miranda]
MGAPTDGKSILPTSNGSGSANLIIELEGRERAAKQLPWYYGPTYLLFWVGLFFAVVIPLFQAVPTALKIAEESASPGKFVAERAQGILLSISQMGPRVVGDHVNEVTIVEYMLAEIAKVRSAMRDDLFDMEWEVQRVSGSYLHNGLVNHYQGVQNVIVKLSTRTSNSSSYLLVNSHYDTKPGSPGAGDDAYMVAVMLEVLRQMAISADLFLHPIVFLFNGGEEQPMLGSHGFITQHRWSANCKALINLDGSGGRELLFQGGPNHPWLMEHYKKSIPHPFATTTGEEIFQAGLIPSDTDFRIFRDFGVVPGLDMAGIYNGFVYHTEFDRYTVISGGALQSTGDNVLALVQSISNAHEMYDTEPYSEGHSVFFDFIGLFFVFYKESTGVVLNICFSIGAMLLVCLSLWRMRKVSGHAVGTFAGAFGVQFLLALAGVVLALALPLIMCVLYDAGDRTLTYFSNSWLVIGLFICPSVIGLILPLTLYLTLRPSEKITHAYHLQIAGHAYCVLLAVLCLVTTALSIRSAYLFLISIVFYVGALIINLVTRLHCRGYYWSFVLGASQLMPFLYHAYLFHTFIVILIPMVGRFGVTTNPDTIIAVLCAFGTILSLSFAAPLINMFRRPKSMLGGLALAMFVFCMISVSDVGFPYRPKTNVMRVDMMQVHRRFFEHDGSMSSENSGYYLHMLDRNKDGPLHDTMNLTGLTRLGEDCDSELMCGIPCYRWCSARKEARWLPREEPVQLPYPTVLELVNKTVLARGDQARLEFRLSGPPNMGLFFKPRSGVKLLRWSFAQGMLDNPATYRPPLQVQITYGIDSTPIEFYVELSKDNGNFDEPVCELGVSGHYVGPRVERDALSEQFLATLPDYTFSMQWPSSYARYIY